MKALSTSLSIDTPIWYFCGWKQWMQAFYYAYIAVWHHAARIARLAHPIAHLFIRKLSWYIFVYKCSVKCKYRERLLMTTTSIRRCKYFSDRLIGIEIVIRDVSGSSSETSARFAEKIAQKGNARSPKYAAYTGNAGLITLCCIWLQ